MGPVAQLGQLEILEQVVPYVKYSSKPTVAFCLLNWSSVWKQPWCRADYSASGEDPVAYSLKNDD